jgi:hypothetical protein
MQILVEETNQYYHHCLDTLEGCPPLPDVTIQEMYLFVTIILQMGHDQRDTLKGYLSKIELSLCTFTETQ